MSKAKQKTWVGEKSRPLRLCRPCPCGCDFRGDPTARSYAGYLTGSDMTSDSWLQEDERSWGDFTGAACFDSAEEAEALRESGSREASIVLGAFH